MATQFAFRPDEMTERKAGAVAGLAAALGLEALIAVGEEQGGEAKAALRELIRTVTVPRAGRRSTCWVN